MKRVILLLTALLLCLGCQRKPITGQPPSAAPPPPLPAESPKEAIAPAVQQVEEASPSAAPVPHLVAEGMEPVEIRGQKFMRYVLRISNYLDYPDELFAPAPSLPPCGNNANASRTWVTIHSARGERLYGFCALRQSEQLTYLWFSLMEGAEPPEGVYVVMTDRALNKVYRSNVVRLPSTAIQ